MYNQELKLKFLEDSEFSTSTKENLHSLFVRASKYEFEEQRDLCEFTEDMVTRLFRNEFGTKANSKATALRRINLYVKWCKQVAQVEKEFTLNPTDAFEHVDLVEHLPTESRLVAGPKHLEEELNKIFQPDIMESTDEQFRALFWLAFCGIPSWDIASELTADNIDFDLLEIKYGGYAFRIFLEGHRALRNVAKLQSFNQTHNDRVKSVPRVEGDQLLRGIKGLMRPDTGRIRLSKLYKAKINAGIDFVRLNYENVYTSGVFYRVYENEVRKNIYPDFRSIVDREMDMMGVSDKTKDNSNYKFKKIAYYKDDYESWKRKFSHMVG